MTTTASATKKRTAEQPDGVAVTALKRRTQQPNTALVLWAEYLEGSLREQAAAAGLPATEQQLRWALAQSHAVVAYLLWALHDSDQGAASDAAWEITEMCEAGEPMAEWVAEHLTRLGVDVEALIADEEAEKVAAYATSSPTKAAADMPTAVTVSQICTALHVMGIDPERVAGIVTGRDNVVITRWALDETGHCYPVADPRALETVVIPIAYERPPAVDLDAAVIDVLRRYGLEPDSVLGAVASDVLQVIKTTERAA